MSTVFDLYEFPRGWTGRKTYVTVRGHRKSVPFIYTYKGADGMNYILPEYGGDDSGYKNYSRDVSTPMIIRDISPYQSVVDGSMITSRSAHREHLAAHGCVEVGNDYVQPSPPPPPTMEERKATRQAIKDHLDNVKAMPERHYQERVAIQRHEALRGQE